MKKLNWIKNVLVPVLALVANRNVQGQVDSVGQGFKGKLYAAAVHEQTNQIFCLNSSGSKMYFSKLIKNLKKWEIVDSIIFSGGEFIISDYHRATKLVSLGQNIYGCIGTNNNYYYVHYDGTNFKITDTSAYKVPSTWAVNHGLFKWQNKVYAYALNANEVVELTNQKSIPNTALSNILKSIKGFFKIISNKNNLIFGVLKSSQVDYQKYYVYNSSLARVDSLIGNFEDFCINSNDIVLINNGQGKHAVFNKTTTLYNGPYLNRQGGSSAYGMFSNNKYSVSAKNYEGQAKFGQFSISKDSGGTVFSADFSLISPQASYDSISVYYVLDTADILYWFSPNAMLESTKVLAIDLSSYSGLKPIDTIFVKAFNDINSNGVFDGSDYYFTDPSYSIQILDDIDHTHVFEYLYNSNPSFYCIPNSNFSSHTQNSSISNNSASSQTLLYIHSNINGLGIMGKVWNNIRLDTNVRLSLITYNSQCNSPITTNSTMKMILPANTIYTGTTGTTSGDTVTWTIPPNELKWGKSTTVKFPFGSFQLGDTIQIPIEIYNAQDAFTANNFDTLRFVLGYSYDPNDKRSSPEGFVQYPVDYITYQVDFQNEGNDYAETVVVLDTLDTRMPIYDVVVGGASHPYSLSIQGNVLRWEFSNINLQAKSVDEEASKGWIVFKTRMRSKLAINERVKNRVGIYFDKNDPVFTSWAVITRVPADTISRDTTTKDTTTKDTSTNSARFVAKQKPMVQLFPNPAQQRVQLHNTSSQAVLVQIVDVQGKLVSAVQLQATETVTLSLAGVSPGMYFIQSGGQTQKLMIE